MAAWSTKKDEIIWELHEENEVKSCENERDTEDHEEEEGEKNIRVFPKWISLNSANSVNHDQIQKWYGY